LDKLKAGFATLMEINELDNSAAEARQALNAAIKGLYRTFARHKLHGPVVGCPHCTSSADDRQLRSKPLHNLTGDDLERFAFKALTTLGTVDDFKHFLPRLLEIAAELEVGSTNFEIVLGKLCDGDSTHWPDTERAAIEQYFIALWRYVLAAFPSSLDASTCLCGIAQAVDDLTPFLSEWQLNASLPALRHLTDFIGQNANEVMKHRKLRNAFWNGRERQMQQVLDWLGHPNISSRLEEAFFQQSTEPMGAELSEAVNYLAWMPKASDRRSDG
jgi:hypothetical protein